MILDLMVLAIALVVIPVRADRAFIDLIPVVLRVHVLATGGLASEVGITGIALETRRTVSCRVTVLISSLPSSRKALSTGAAFEHLEGLATEKKMLSDRR